MAAGSDLARIFAGIGEGATSGLYEHLKHQRDLADTYAGKGMSYAMSLANKQQRKPTTRLTEFALINGKDPNNIELELQQDPELRKKFANYITKTDTELNRWKLLQEAFNASQAGGTGSGTPPGSKKGHVY